MGRGGWLWRVGSKSVLQYRYHGREENSPCGFRFLADHVSNGDWNDTAPACGYMACFVYKPGEYFQVRGTLYDIIGYPGLVRFIAGDAAAGRIGSPGFEDHPGSAAHNRKDPGDLTADPENS